MEIRSTRMNLMSEKLDILIFNYRPLFAQTYRSVKAQNRIFKGTFGAYRNELRGKPVIPVPHLNHATLGWIRNGAVG